MKRHILAAEYVADTVALVLYQITHIPELHDRLISASARFLNLELITNDAKIQNSSFVQTVW